MANRREFTRKTRAQAFERCGGCCEECGAKLKVGEGEYDHRIPCAMGGEATLDNCQVLCRVCHRAPGAKTAQDVANISKAKRREHKHLGIKRTKSRGFWKPEGAKFNWNKGKYEAER